MTEIERLTQIGTKYLTAARQVILADLAKHEDLDLSPRSIGNVLAIAQMIATADRQPPETMGQMVFMQPIEKKEFSLRWEIETGYASEITRPFGDHFNAALVGDRVYLREYVCPEFRKKLTGRVIIGRISEISYSPIPEPDQRVKFAILRKEGSHD